MKQYVIDELRQEDYEKLKSYMDEAFGSSAMSGIYWIPVHEDFLADAQKAHENHRPFYFVADLTPDKLACELLVRTKERVRCDCICYANEKQRNWIIPCIEAIFEKLDIIT